jgi:hypothetical protein
MAIVEELGGNALRSGTFWRIEVVLTDGCDVRWKVGGYESGGAW